MISKLVIGATIVAALPALLGDRPCWAEVRYEKFIQLPANRTEHISVTNRLGSVRVIGWDRPSIKISAIKQAPDAALAERLRVEVNAHGDAMTVKTYVWMRHASNTTARRILEKRRALLRAIFSEKVDQRLLARELERLQKELAESHALANSRASQGSKLGLPLPSGRLDLEIRLPRKVAVRARTFKHNLRVSGCAAGTHLRTEEGQLFVSNVQGTVDTWAQSGRQELTGISGNVAVNGGSAGVKLRKIRGLVVAELSTGNIDARDVGAQRVQLRTISGNIVLGIGKRGRYSLVTLRGHVSLRLPQRPSMQLSGAAARWDFGRYAKLARGQGNRRRLVIGTGHATVGVSNVHGNVVLLPAD